MHSSMHVTARSKHPELDPCECSHVNRCCKSIMVLHNSSIVADLHRGACLLDFTERHSQKYMPWPQTLQATQSKVLGAGTSLAFLAALWWRDYALMSARASCPVLFFAISQASVAKGLACSRAAALEVVSWAQGTCLLHYTGRLQERFQGC